MASKKSKTKGGSPELNAEQRELLNDHGWEHVSGGVGEPWTEGQIIRGTLVEVRDSHFEQDDGGFAKLVEIDTENGVRVFRCPTVLANRLETVASGDELMITCNGKIKTNAGRTAWDFTVLVKRNSPRVAPTRNVEPVKKPKRGKKG